MRPASTHEQLSSPASSPTAGRGAGDAGRVVGGLPGASVRAARGVSGRLRSRAPSPAEPVYTRRSRGRATTVRCGGGGGTPRMDTRFVRSSHHDRGSKRKPRPSLLPSLHPHGGWQRRRAGPTCGRRGYFFLGGARCWPAQHGYPHGSPTRPSVFFPPDHPRDGAAAGRLAAYRWRGAERRGRHLGTGVVGIQRGGARGGPSPSPAPRGRRPLAAAAWARPCPAMQKSHGREKPCRAGRPPGPYRMYRRRGRHGIGGYVSADTYNLARCPTPRARSPSSLRKGWKHGRASGGRQRRKSVVDRRAPSSARTRRVTAIRRRRGHRIDIGMGTPSLANVRRPRPGRVTADNRPFALGIAEINIQPMK